MMFEKTYTTFQSVIRRWQKKCTDKGLDADVDLRNNAMAGRYENPG